MTQNPTDKPFKIIDRKDPFGEGAGPARARRMRSVAIAVALVLFVVLIFIVSVLRLTGHGSAA